MFGRFRSPPAPPAAAVPPDDGLQLRPADAGSSSTPAALQGFDRVALVTQLQAALATGNNTAAAELIASAVAELQGALVYLAAGGVVAGDGAAAAPPADVAALDVRLQRVENYFQWDASDAQRAVDAGQRRSGRSSRRCRRRRRRPGGRVDDPPATAAARARAARRRRAAAAPPASPAPGGSAIRRVRSITAAARV
jgi:hypothetical protein